MDLNNLERSKSVYVTGFVKSDLMGTNTSVDKNHTHALSKDTKHLMLDGQVYFYRQFFFRCCLTKKVHFMACVAPERH